MTQAAVNNAIVLYRLAVERRDVEEAQRVYFVTEKLAQTLANPLIPLTKKYDIIEKVYGFESEPKLITSFIKEMVKLGYAAEMNEIFEAYYRYWDEKNHIIRAELISAEPQPTRKQRTPRRCYKANIRNMKYPLHKEWTKHF